MDHIKCKVKDKILLLDRAVVVNTTKKSFNLFSIVNPKIVTTETVKIMDSDKFRSREVV